MTDAQHACRAELAALASLAHSSGGEYIKRKDGHCMLNIADAPLDP
jgi:hypothetical protein